MPGKKSKVELGVQDKNLANAIKQELGYSVNAGTEVQEFIRGIRLFADKLLKGLKTGDLDKAQLGLGHSYSRAKVKFNVNRVDNMIIQAISLLDQLDKDVNTFSMRVRYAFTLAETNCRKENGTRGTFPSSSRL
jgi:nucleolar protein 56